MDTTPSEEVLVEGLKSFAAEVEGTPTARGMRREGPYSPHYYKEKFGSWHDALRAANIQPTHGVDPDVDREMLLQELQRIDELIEPTPRRRDVDEYGKFSYSLYVEEFESFVLALEEAGIDPDEKQYRFSSVETPKRKKGSENLQKLRDEGPTPSKALPRGRSTADRENGIWKFTMSSGAIQPANAIYYLDGEHAPELVLRRFFQQNPHVLEYRTPHGIKQHIRNHKPSWKEIGQDIVDELMEEGLVPDAEFENLVVIRTGTSETLKACFDSSVASLVEMDGLPLDEGEYTNQRPVWGFSREHKDIWQAISEKDGLLFSTKPGVFTHYIPIIDTLENSNVMTELWVEYEDGVRSGGIENPWPYLVIGEDVREVTIWEEEMVEEIDSNLDERPTQHLTEEEMEPLLNSYGGFEPFLRDRGRLDTPVLSGADLDENPSTQDVLDLLLQITDDDLPLERGDSALEDVSRKVREEAFREGILEIYSGCAICGKLFESPRGTLDLEAAHILPKSEDGPDLLQNGLGLCSRHHWAFDNGWFEIATDYEIHVRKYPELEGYEELKQYDGAYLHIPTEKEFQPHPHYLRQRAIDSRWREIE